MKRIILIVCIMFVSLLLVGCGSKHQLICTKKLDNSESKIVAYFNNKNNKLVKMEMSIVLEAGDEKAAKDVKENACKDIEYESCKANIKGTKVIVTYEQNKINKNKQSTLKDAKKAIEKENYTCTKK